MPILTSILDHEVIGPAILQGRAEGLADVSRRLLQKRFGPLPAWVDSRLSSLSAPELEDLAVRLLDAPNLDSVFSR